MSESSVDQPETGPRSEEELRRILRTKTDPLAALQQGIQLMRHGAGLGLGALVVYSAISAAGAGMAKEFSIELIGSEPDVYSAWAFLLLLVSALLALYTLIQFVKRDRVTRASWIPSLFLVASLAMYGAMSLGPSMGGTNNTQLAPLVPTLVMIAWDLVWESFGGAALVFIWLSCAHAGMNGRELVPSDLFADLRRRWLDVAAVHGAKFHAVQIGMQVVIPGIFYALSLAFADMIVVLDPERPALKRSAQLTLRDAGPIVQAAGDLRRRYPRAAGGCLCRGGWHRRRGRGGSDRGDVHQPARTERVQHSGHALHSRGCSMGGGVGHVGPVPGA